MIHNEHSRSKTFAYTLNCIGRMNGAYLLPQSLSVWTEFKEIFP